MKRLLALSIILSVVLCTALPSSAQRREIKPKLYPSSDEASIHSGYRTFIDLGLGAGADDDVKFMADLEAVRGFQFGRRFFTGIGIGVHQYEREDPRNFSISFDDDDHDVDYPPLESYTIAPVFLSLKWADRGFDLLSDVYSIDFGYSAMIKSKEEGSAIFNDDGGIYISARYGMNVPLGDRSSILLSAGWTLQGYSVNGNQRSINCAVLSLCLHWK